MPWFVNWPPLNHSLLLPELGADAGLEQQAR